MEELWLLHHHQCQVGASLWKASLLGLDDLPLLPKPKHSMLPCCGLDQVVLEGPSNRKHRDGLPKIPSSASLSQLEAVSPHPFPPSRVQSSSWSPFRLWKLLLDLLHSGGAPNRLHDGIPSGNAASAGGLAPGNGLKRKRSPRSSGLWDPGITSPKLGSWEKLHQFGDPASLVAPRVPSFLVEKPVWALAPLRKRNSLPPSWDLQVPSWFSRCK